MEFTAENLEKAVSLFYRSEAGQQAQAHQWLTEAQNSPQAWSFVWELLQPHRSSEVQFFAATTLHTKLLKYWNEVPEDHYELLKERILDAIVRYAMGPKIVLNRLCIALSAYILHTITSFWQDAFKDLISSFQPQNLPSIEPQRIVWILLEILTVIPEEFQSMSLATTQKLNVKCALQDVAGCVLNVIEACLLPGVENNFRTESSLTYLNCARCATTWMQLDRISIIDCNNLPSLFIELTCSTYWNRQNLDFMSSEESELTEAALEALTAIMTHPFTHKYPTAIMHRFNDMLEKFMKIVDVERNKRDHNKDIVSNIYSLIVQTADMHTKLLIKNLMAEGQPEQDVTLWTLRAILSCSDMPGSYPVDESSSTLTFGFWYTLQDEILSLDGDECTLCLKLIKPFYRDLVSIMIRKSMFPSSDDNGNWTLDDREVLRCYRQDIADTMLYCYNVLNVEMLDILNNKLTEAIAKCSDNGSVVAENWPYIEACLHAYFAVAESIEVEDVYLPKLMQILKEIPYQELHARVLATALDTVGAYAEWITQHPDMLENVVPFIISGLTNPDVVPSATLALKDLTHNCQKYIGPFANVILHSCQSALQSGMLKLSECIRLMFSVGKVLSIMPVPNIMEYLNVILTPYFKEIQTLVSTEQTPTVSTALVTRLKMLSSLFCSLYVKPPSFPEGTVQQPIFLVVQNTLPLYREIANKWGKNTEVMEVLCTTLKHAITTLMDDSKPLANDLIQLIIASYRELPQASVVNLARTVLFMFGKEEMYTETVELLMFEIVNVTLQMCAHLTENGSNNLSERADVLEGFFAMMSQITKKNPGLLLSRGVDSSALFQCAILCLAMPEIPVLKSCSSFLGNFISQSRETSLSEVVNSYGEQLVIRILLNLGGSVPRAAVDLMNDLILVLNKKYCDNLARWLNGTLPQEGFPSQRISRHHKELFVKAVLREKVNKRRLLESVLEFALICRGIVKPQESTWNAL